MKKEAKGRTVPKTLLTYREKKQLASVLDLV